jgi:hypothetical protein
LSVRRELLLNFVELTVQATQARDLGAS